MKNFFVILTLIIEIFFNSFYLKAENNSLIVKNIILQGLRKNSPAFILRQLQTKKGKKYSPEILDKDIKYLYALGRFLDIKSEIIKERDGIVVKLYFKEKPVLKKVEFQGNRKVRTSILKQKVTLKKGDYIDPYIVKKDIEEMKKEYHKKGYYFVKINIKEKILKDGTILIFVIDEGAQVRVKDIIFEGNKHIEEDDILDVMKTQPDTLWTSGIFNEEEFEEDLIRIRNLYISKGWLDVKVEKEYVKFSPENIKKIIEIRKFRTDERWLRRKKQYEEKIKKYKKAKERSAYIKIKIHEGPRYKLKAIKIKGNKLFSTQEIMNVIAPPELKGCPDDRLLELKRLQIGGAYSPIVLEPVRKAIKDLYGKKGYMFTKVNIKEDIAKKGEIILTFDITEGHKTVLNEVKIVGNTKTKDIVIRRELEIIPGEEITSDKIEESKVHLDNLDYFETIDIDLEEISDGVADAIVKVKEKKTGSFKIGVGFSSIEQIVGNVSISQRNFDWRDWPTFTGDGQSLTLTARGGTHNRRYSIDFLEPWVDNKPIHFGFGAYTWKNDLTIWDEGSTGFYTLIGKRIKKYLDFTLKVGTAKYSIEDIDPATSNEIKKEAGTSRKRFLAFIGVKDTRDRKFFTRKGYKITLYQEVSLDVLGGDIELYKTGFTLEHYKTLKQTYGEKYHILATRIDIQNVTSFGTSKYVPIFDRFFPGGAGTVRGYWPRTLCPKDSNGDYIGGTFMTTGSIEYTMPLYKKIIRGALFFDAGYSWERASKFTFGDIHKSIGLGIRVWTPLGKVPIKLDYGFALDRDGYRPKGRFDFSFGYNF